MFKKLFLSTLLLISTQSFAATEQWFMGTISALYPLSDGSFIVLFNEDSTECSDAGKYHWVVVGQNNVTTEGAERMLSTVMAAGMANKQININFDKDSSKCYINRMQLIF